MKRFTMGDRRRHGPYLDTYPQAMRTLRAVNPDCAALLEAYRESHRLYSDAVGVTERDAGEQPPAGPRRRRSAACAK